MGLTKGTRMKDGVVNCVLIRTDLGSGYIVIGEYPSYDMAYAAARDLPLKGYRSFRIVVTTTEVYSVELDLKARTVPDIEEINQRRLAQHQRLTDLEKLSDDKLALEAELARKSIF